MTTPKIDEKLLFDQRKAWLDYISRLIDRHTRAARETGLTIWATLGAASVIFARNYDKLINFNMNDPQAAWGYAILFNALAAAALLVALLKMLTFKNDDKPRFLAEAYGSVRKNKIIILWAYVALLFLPPNIYLIFRPGIPNSWAYELYSGAYLFFLSTAIFNAINDYRKRRKANIPAIISTFSIGNKYLVILKIIIGLITIVLVVTFLISANDFLFSIKKNGNLAADTFRSSVEVVAGLALLFQMYRFQLKDQVLEHLKNLETNILVDSLDHKDIAVEFTKIYLGVNVIEWINKQDEHLEMLLIKLREQAVKSIEIIESIADLPEELGHEKRGRANDACEKMTLIQKEFGEKIKQRLNVYKYLLTSTASGSFAFKELICGTESKVDAMKNVSESVCDRCKTIYKNKCKAAL